MVHKLVKSVKTQYLVLGLTFVESAGNPSKFLGDCISNFERNGPQTPITINDGELLPEDGEVPIFYYKGSLTTPPCSEVVEWYVVATPLAAASNQLAFFRNVLLSEKDKGNYRVPMNIAPYPGILNTQTVYQTILATTSVEELAPFVVNAAEGVVAVNADCDLELRECLGEAKPKPKPIKTTGGVAGADAGVDSADAAGGERLRKVLGAQ
eukprot:Selendium_serpulae@DN4690_c0_g1_i3.p1